MLAASGHFRNGRNDEIDRNAGNGEPPPEAVHSYIIAALSPQLSSDVKEKTKCLLRGLPGPMSTKTDKTIGVLTAPALRRYGGRYAGNAGIL
jgi:hypothetical protein